MMNHTTEVHLPTRSLVCEKKSLAHFLQSKLNPGDMSDKNLLCSAFISSVTTVGHDTFHDVMLLSPLLGF